MSKHTKGPWNWTSELSDKGALTGKQIIYDNNETLGYRYRDIAHLPACKSKAETRANARLIAAAPELLEACKIALKHARNKQTGYGFGQLELEEAIAKAEGSGE